MRSFRFLLPCLPVFLVSTISVEAQTVSLKTDEQKYGYAVGTRVGAQLMDQFSHENAGVDLPALLAGISDVIQRVEQQMTDQEAIEVIEARQMSLQIQAQARAEAAAKAGDEWRAENRKKEGVTETQSGVQYSISHSGEASGVSPGPDDTVVVHYRGAFLDGREFDSSYMRGVPAIFPLSGIIPGWREVLQLMRPGDKWNVVIPPELAYAEQGSGAIGPNETLLFEIELLEVKSQ